MSACKFVFVEVNTLIMCVCGCVYAQVHVSLCMCVSMFDCVCKYITYTSVWPCVRVRPRENRVFVVLFLNATRPLLRAWETHFFLFTSRCWRPSRPGSHARSYIILYPFLARFVDTGWSRTTGPQTSFFFCGTAVERWTHPSAARDGFSQYYWTESQKYFPADLTHRFHENRLKKYFFISVQIYHFFLNRQLLLGFQKLALHYVRVFNTHKGCAQCWLSSSYVKIMYLLVKTKRTSKNDKLFVLVQKIYSNNKPQNYQLTPHRIVFLRAMIYHCFQT